EAHWGADGLDAVEFLVATNPGNPPGTLGKIASGGELSRFMLALKVVLARTSSTPTMVFDEVDSGIGGAVAAAVGERLARLGTDLQVLVVTHSPQVAARGRNHYRVAKQEVAAGKVLTSVEELPQEARREEIARMLAGEIITDQARAAADSLMAV
ncbi:MAG: DNA repair protein RecN, partial [Magnetospirillum sp.]|nr:DNA repair protein RecN [Magnetospirillum sp.]